MKKFFLILTVLLHLKHLVDCGCPLLQQDIAFLFEESSIINSKQFSQLLDFAVNLTSIDLTVARTETRVGAVTFGSTQRVLFGFLNYTSHRQLQDALRQTNFTDANGTLPDVGAALRFLRDTFLSRTYGNRLRIPNYVILITSTTDNDAVIAASELRTVNHTNIIAIGTDNADMNQLVGMTGKTGNAFYLNSFDDIDYSVAERVRRRMLYCPYNKVYVMSDSVFTITCCGLISVWEFLPGYRGKVDFLVWRPVNDTSLRLVGINSVVVKDADIGTIVKHPVRSYEQIAIIQGDIIGWRSNGINVMTYTDCFQRDDITCPKSNLVSTSPTAINVYAGLELNISQMTSIPDRAYFVKVITTENTDLVFSKTTINKIVPDHLKADDIIMELELTGIDYKEEISYNITHNLPYDYFHLDFERKNIKLARDLDRDRHDYQFLILAEDSCRHTATATFSISTVNWPPIIQNLPRTVTLSEAVRGVTMVYNLTVTDGGDDPICCSIYDTSPLTTNFQLRQNGSDVAVVTSPWAAFHYDKVNSYLIYVCCEDETASAKALLQVDVKKEASEKKYRHPVWLYVAVAVSIVPMVIILTLSYAVICSVMFRVDDPEPRRTVIRIKRYKYARDTCSIGMTSSRRPSQISIIYDSIRFRERCDNATVCDENGSVLKYSNSCEENYYSSAYSDYSTSNCV